MSFEKNQPKQYEKPAEKPAEKQQQQAEQEPDAHEKKPAKPVEFTRTGKKIIKAEDEEVKEKNEAPRVVIVLAGTLRYDGAMLTAGNKIIGMSKEDFDLLSEQKAVKEYKE